MKRFGHIGHIGIGHIGYVLALHIGVRLHNFLNLVLTLPGYSGIDLAPPAGRQVDTPGFSFNIF